jgi:hypothetical protein
VSRVLGRQLENSVARSLSACAQRQHITGSLDDRAAWWRELCVRARAPSAACSR